MPLANGYAGFAKALARARRTVVVGSEHAYLTVMFWDFPGLRKRITALLLRLGYRRLTAVVAVSSGIAARLARAGLVILGEGEERERLEAPADELDIGDRVQMPGWAACIGPYFRAAASYLSLFKALREGRAGEMLDGTARS